MRRIIFSLVLGCCYVTFAAAEHDAITQIRVSPELSIQFTDNDRQLISSFYLNDNRLRDEDDDHDKKKKKKKHKHKHKKKHDHDDEDDDEHDEEHSRHDARHEHGKNKDMPPGLARREQLPPGLRRQLQRHGRLPPGLQGRALPVDLDRQLPRLPENHVRLVIEKDIVIVDKTSRLILDVIHDIIQ